MRNVQTNGKRKANRKLTIARASRHARPHPLQFYDPELQILMNTPQVSRASLQRAAAKSKRLFDSYINQIRALRKRLGKKTYRRFSDVAEPLFDSDLLELTCGDSVGWGPDGTRNRYKTRVNVTFLSFDGKAKHILKYRNIDSLLVNVPTERWFLTTTIDSLLWNELTAISKTLMQHRFLFASGATIAIKFENVSWDTNRVRK